MRTRRRTWVVPMTAALVAVGVACGTVSRAQDQRGAAPCTKAASACTEWVSVAGGSQRLLVYRSYALDVRNQNITRAMIEVHGGARNADDIFKTALAAAFLAGALEVVAPRFASNTGVPPWKGEAPCTDTLAPDEANWSCEDQRPEGWNSGGGAIGNEKLTSFDFVDEILRKLARKETFPNLNAIVIAGMSDGGWFTLRYAMANQAHDKLSVPMTYVVSNPDALVYLDPLRPSASALAPPEGQTRICCTAAGYPSTASAPGYDLAAPAEPFVPFVDARNCATYDQWPYGLQNRTGYAARLTDEQLKRQLSTRPVTYLLGRLDILPTAGLDDSCPAMAQGPARLARGIAFSRYMNEKYGAQHKTIVLPACGHSPRCMFTANPALPLLFSKQQ